MEEKVLKAIGDVKRFQLMQLMSKQGYCVSALARSCQLSESAVSQHLKVLREAGLVYGVKRGYYTHYCVDKEALGGIIAELQQMLLQKPTPCAGPFYGCEQAEFIRCKSYVPPEERKEKDLC